MFTLTSCNAFGRKLSSMLLTVIGTLAVFAQEPMSLSGMWDFSVGDSLHYDDQVLLPGSMLTNGKGTPVSVHTRWTGSLYDSSFYFNPYMEKYRREDHMKFPFFLTPERHYVGAAWYRRSVYVPESWKNNRIELFLERPHIETIVYVNGIEAGHQMSLSVPHRYDITELLCPGHRNSIAICVYNGIENVGVGQDSHSVTDQTQGNWNGIVGRMELVPRSKEINISRVRIVPQPTSATARVIVDLEGNTRLLSADNLMAEVHTPQGGSIRMTNGKKTADKQYEFVFLFGDELQTWDEFTPACYRLTVCAGEEIYETTFGMREIAVKGRQLYINGRPLFLRGTVENCCFPETGYPPTEEDEWLRIFRKCKEYGLNHVRFHSYCPPEAAFSAADQVGIYLQPEGPSWPNHGVKLRQGQSIDQYLLEESRRIVDTYGHHPSFVMMAAGNEPAGNWVEYCREWVAQMHLYDPTRIYCGASVGGGWAWDEGSEFHVKGGARGLEWSRQAPQSQDNYYDQIEFPRNYRDSLPNNSPIIAHEQGQWCAFPDFREISQYTGVYKARNFEIFRDLLRDNGMEEMAGKFLEASGRLQTLCYKYEIERNLRTPDYTGFQLLGLNDYSGQGTALVGPLNVMWREKGYCTARDWTQFCSPFVLLARFPRFVYTNGDTLRVPMEAYNALYGNVTQGYTIYTISDEEQRVYAEGLLPVDSIPLGKNTQLGEIVFPLGAIREPKKLTLTAHTGNSFTNHWDFWVYPTDCAQPSASSIFIADTLDTRAINVLKKGGTVLLTAAGRVTLGSDVVQHYLPVFWNTSWFKMRPPHTTGAYIDRSHPLFKYGFPTDNWTNLNWWELLNRAQVMNLMELPTGYQPPIQPIDTWHVSRKLGMLIEARVLKGRLLMTTMDISSNLDRRIVARQMRQAILAYMESNDFQPEITLSPDIITHFFTRQAQPVNMFTNDSPDELKPKLK